MVEWKGNTTSKSGTKARRLDSLEGFNVPNFFVITAEDLRQLFGAETNPQQLLNTSLDSEVKKEIRDAHEDVGMSSEVRKASGKAKSLVGGQRNNQFVSIRVSDSGREAYDYKLNTGSSNFFNALKEVVVSYLEKNDSFPPVLVQKMVEPGYTATVQHFNDFTLIESVKGLGTSLEEGLTVPMTYIVRDDGLERFFAPDKQLEITRSPVRAGNQRRNVDIDSNPFERRDIENLAADARETGFNIKVVYKRGSFHVVDAYRSSTEDDPVITEEAVRASPGRIQGVVGEDVKFSDRPENPEKFDKALIASKGGYTSREGHRIREAGKPAIFQFKDELRDGQRVDIGSDSVSVEASNGIESNMTGQRRSKQRNKANNSVNPFKSDGESVSGVTGCEVLPVDPRTGRGVCIQRKSSRGFVLTDRETEASKIPREGLVDDYQGFFTFDVDRVIVDARRMDKNGLIAALGFLEADLKILVMSDPEREIIRAAIDSGFRVFGVPESSIDEFERTVESEERRFMLDKLGDLE